MLAIRLQKAAREMNTDRSCAVFGQHPLRFPWGFDEEAEGCRRMKLELAHADDTAGQSGAQLEQQALRYEIRADKK